MGGGKVPLSGGWLLGMMVTTLRPYGFLVSSTHRAAITPEASAANAATKETLRVGRESPAAVVGCTSGGWCF